MRYGGLAWLVLLSAGMAEESRAFRIVAPEEQAALQPAQVITVAIDVEADIAIGRVRYYWYRLDDEPAVDQHVRPALVADAADTLPYGGPLNVPPEGIGPMRLLAIGEVTSGRLAGREEFDEIIVQIHPAAALSRIEFESDKPLKLDTVGQILEVPAVGIFADGMVRPIRSLDAGSTFRSSNDGVATILPDGTMRVVGDGIASIIVCNRGQQGSLPVVVKTSGEPNQPPIAQAGTDQVIKGGSKVVLDGLRSVDPDGDPLRYEWRQVRGNKVSLLDPNTPKPTFVAPKVSARRLLRFRLQVTDMEGPDTVKGANSVPSFVNVWVDP
jgi:K319-like protein